MNPDIIIRLVGKDELSPALFASFDRYQAVRRCWRKENEEWKLKDIAFIEQWNEADYRELITLLTHTLDTGGALIGAFRDSALIGFASVETRPLGARGNYRQLSELYVSAESRGCGIGRQLFAAAAEAAKGFGAEKLYISAHSAEETEAFYRAMGCREAEEYDAALTAAEPCDCQLEYPLPMNR